MAHPLLFVLLPCALLMGAFSTSRAVGQETPSYILVKSEEVRRVVGPDVAARILSHELTELRKRELLGTLSGVPGFDCSNGSRFGLAGIVALPNQHAGKAWIERYIVECNKTAKRSVLMHLGDRGVQAFALLPGDTIGDPVLQKGALDDLTPLALAKGPRDCKDHYVFDTAVTERPQGGAWSERWAFMVCGSVVEVDARFVPAPGGGTSVIGHVSR